MNMFNKIRLKSEEEIEIIQKSSLLVGKTLAEVAKYIKPGVPLLYLDRIAETYIRDNGGVPSFKGYNGFPASLCLSVNDVVVHGIPKEGMVLVVGPDTGRIYSERIVVLKTISNLCFDTYGHSCKNN